MVGGDALSLLTLAIMVLGNALLAGLAVALLVKPFFGPLGDTPQKPHEAPIGMLAGPLLFGVLAVVAGLLPGLSGDYFVVPGASAIAGEAIDTELHLVVDPTSVLFWLSVATWALGLLVYFGLARLRGMLASLNAFSFDAAFDALIFGLIRLSATVSRLIQNGRLEVYLFIVFLMFVIASLVPLVALGGLPQWPPMPDLTFYEWGVVSLAVIGVVLLLLAQNRLFAILALGIQGMAVALLFMLFGAPDLSFTQFMVEILSVVILALVMTRLNLDERDARPPRDAVLHAAVAGLAGLGVMLLLFVVLQGTLDPTLSDFFNLNSKPAAHGSNVVNVILVDFRGLDTLGEISVVMAAGIAVLALIRGGRRRGRS
jgi:multicomponent Na+:H+ antiporter subunit A